MSEPTLHQRHKRFTRNFVFLETEDPRQNSLCVKDTNDKTAGMKVLSSGKQIKKLRDWLNTLPL